MTITRVFPATPSYSAVTLTYADGVLSHVIGDRATVAQTGISASDAYDVIAAVDCRPVCGVIKMLDSVLLPATRDALPESRTPHPLRGWGLTLANHLMPVVSYRGGCCVHVLFSLVYVHACAMAQPITPAYHAQEVIRK